ncbi:MAG: hypothetical protein FWC24_06015 [Treponema sp.]|nr:hypothetical protein [Treponema sp.]
MSSRIKLISVILMMTLAVMVITSVYTLTRASRLKTTETQYTEKLAVSR